MVNFSIELVDENHMELMLEYSKINRYGVSIYYEWPFTTKRTNSIYIINTTKQPNKLAHWKIFIRL